MERSNECVNTALPALPSTGSSGSSTPIGSNPRREPELVAQPIITGEKKTSTKSPSWLNITLDAALGCRANVFHITKIAGPGKKSGNEHRHISIHPQAVTHICR